MNIINKIKDNICERGIEAMLFTSPVSIRYISGFSCSDGAVLVTKDEAYLIVDFRYTEAAQNMVRELKVVSAQDSVSKTLKSLAKDISSIAVEEDHVTMQQLDRYNKLFKGARIVSIGNLLTRMRQIKTPQEVENIKCAQRIGEEALTHILPYIKQGVSERDIACEIEYYMRRAGAFKTSFDTIALSGPNTSLPHGVPGDRKVTYGDFVLMDFGCVYNDYCSDMTRTVAFGYADEEMKKVYNIVYQAQKAAVSNIKSGMTGIQADAFARDIINDQGYGKMFGHSLGHGVGLEIHEEPRFSPLYEDIIPQGCVMSVEPGIYLPGKFGVRIEDLVLVSKEGALNLNTSNKELIIL